MTRSGIFHRLSRDALKTIETNHPELGFAFHRMIVELVSERLRSTNETVESLLD
ncbi:MAG: hypothetical protein ABEK50_07530 [bacterium]